MPSLPSRANVLHFFQFVPIWVLVMLSSLLTPRLRGRLWSHLGGVLARMSPELRRRVDHNLRLVMPELGPQERKRLTAAVGRHFALTYSELLFNRQFGNAVGRFDMAGPGMAAVREAHATGTGCIIVSGHFGQWEAIRHVLKAQEMTCSAIYKPNRNSYFDKLYAKNIRCGGEPLFETGAAGMRALVRHLRGGGLVSLLLDQRYIKGDVLEFIGRPAFTSTHFCELALRFSVPIVPAYGTRSRDGRILVDFEEPIEESDPILMTQKINDSLTERVRKNPEQYHWMHWRWKYASPALDTDEG